MFILPVPKDDYVGKTPCILISLVVINTALLIVTYYATPNVVFLQYGFIPAQHRLATIFSSMFLHAGFWHLLGNMFFLWIFGKRVENTFGAFFFSLVYLACGIGASAAHYISNPSSAIPCVGASGAISGMAGCYLVLFPKSRFDLEVYLFRFHVKSIPTNTKGAVGAWIGEQTLLGLLTSALRFSSIAFWAHVGGFATGVLITFIAVQLAPQLRNSWTADPVDVPGTIEQNAPIEHAKTYDMFNYK